MWSANLIGQNRSLKVDNIKEPIPFDWTIADPPLLDSNYDTEIEPGVKFRLKTEPTAYLQNVSMLALFYSKGCSVHVKAL